MDNVEAQVGPGQAGVVTLAATPLTLSPRPLRFQHACFDCRKQDKDVILRCLIGTNVMFAPFKCTHKQTDRLPSMVCVYGLLSVPYRALSRARPLSFCMRTRRHFSSTARV